MKDTGAYELADVAERLWAWLASPDHSALLRLWVESYAQSLVDPEDPRAGFARDTVRDWLDLLAEAQPPQRRTHTLTDRQSGPAQLTSGSVTKMQNGWPAGSA